MALPVAKALDAPLDLLLVRKIGVPGQRELAAGALVDGPPEHIVFNSYVMRGTGLSEGDLKRGCSACGGGGAVRFEMTFLPDVWATCDTCNGSGFRQEAWDVSLRGVPLPSIFAMTIDEVLDAQLLTALFGLDVELTRHGGRWAARAC